MPNHDGVPAQGLLSPMFTPNASRRPSIARLTTISRPASVNTRPHSADATNETTRHSVIHNTHASEAREILTQQYDTMVEGTLLLSEGTKLSRGPTTRHPTMLDQSHGESLPTLNGKNYARKFLGTEWNAHLVSELKDNRNYDFKFNVAVVGAKGTGKRALIVKECEEHDKNSYDEGRRPVNWGLHVEYKEKSYILKSTLTRVEYWISNTSEEYLHQTARLLSSSAGIIFVYDVCNRRSFLEIQKWLHQMNNRPFHSETYVAPKVLLANTIDSKKLRLILRDEGERFAQANKMHYHECRSDDRTTFKDVFYSLARLVIDPLTDGQHSDLPLLSVTNGFVRTRIAVSSLEKLNYTAALDRMIPRDQITTKVDWI